MDGKLIDEIDRLRKERKAVILAHNYTWSDVQDVADFTGDSLELARRAATVGADVIVFCGVYFMAETAAILNPEKTVLSTKIPVLLSTRHRTFDFGKLVGFCYNHLR